jgi:hypothetical protein
LEHRDAKELTANSKHTTSTDARGVLHSALTVDQWRTLRGVVGSIDVSGKLSAKLGSKPGRFLLEINWWPDHHPSINVFAGNIEVMDILPDIPSVTKAASDARTQEAKLHIDQMRDKVAKMEAEHLDSLDEEAKARDAGG